MNEEHSLKLENALFIPKLVALIVSGKSENYGGLYMNKIITEITPLSEKDCFYLVDRTKDEFTFPIHHHAEFELNFVEGCKGAMRVVGDSMEELPDFDLCLVGHGIEHAWEQHNCTNRKIREITVQFSADLFGDNLLNKNQMSEIRKMLANSSKGIAFSQKTIMRVYSLIEKLLTYDSGFYQMVEFLKILYELANDSDYRLLASSSFAKARVSSDSRRVSKAQDYISSHYKEEIRLSDLAGLVGMTPTSFSRFFKLRTGRSVSDYIIDIRLGMATRALMESTTSIAEICFDCGFNNVSNFNRIFKKKKNCSPKEFREYYQKHKILI